ncbi:MAG: hypothetical protein G8D91_00400 [gamma proteobacterium symbiont of Clathrolucina costata]
MEAKNRYFAAVIVHLMLGIGIGYVAGQRDGTRPPINPSHFHLAADQLVDLEAAECSKRTGVPCG